MENKLRGILKLPNYGAYIVIEFNISKKVCDEKTYYTDSKP